MYEYSIQRNRSYSDWNHSRTRGLEKVSLFCIDGLEGMETVIEECFPMAKIQRCLVHVSRNISKKVRVSDRKEVYQSKIKSKSKKELKQFIKKWKRKYPKVIEMLEKNERLFAYYSYPESIRPT